ncbi:thioredoxin-dependent thiol peroxidase [Sphingobium sp. AN641]|uniref:thioredoxin-dependent thiol peroxidase n=1 Tax=Sphingobium sp. AN641 TaxID=3133443 RepID=UPI0030C1CDC9
MLTKGDNAPNVTLKDSDGGDFTLERYRGKPLVVYFYPKADTPGCTNEAKDFTTLADAFASAGVPVIGVSRDTPAKLKKFAAKYGLAVILASDEGGEFCEAFGTWVEKSLYGRKYMGVERATFLVGADGVVQTVWPKVKVKGHAQAVLEAVQAL